jgi:hypothetical protein
MLSGTFAQHCGSGTIYSGSGWVAHLTLGSFASGSRPYLLVDVQNLAFLMFEAAPLLPRKFSSHDFSLDFYLEIYGSGMHSKSVSDSAKAKSSGFDQIRIHNTVFAALTVRVRSCDCFIQVIFTSHLRDVHI